MRILGIDPGIATIGFGVIDFSGREYKLVNCGVITTPAHTMLSARLEQIYDDMCQLLELFKPDAVSIEELFSIRILRPVLPLHTGGECSFWRAERPASQYMNIRRFRSSRPSSDMAGQRRSR